MSEQAAELPDAVVDSIIPVRMFTADDLGTIQAAYDVLLRVGNETADDGTWNEYIDRAHQDLGLILAVHTWWRAAATVPGKRSRWWPGHRPTSRYGRVRDRYC